MKSRFFKTLKFLAFCVCLGLLICWINGTFTAKYMYDQREPHTETYKGFYNMNRNTVDVLILGTSHAASGFNPQDFYDEQKLRTYNLASSAQPVWASYYWLEEALKYQKPSVLIFDCNYLFSNYNDEGAIRKALDNMRFGKTKLDAIDAAVKYDTETEESRISYLFPFIRYHSRWTSLNEWDFTWVKGVEEPSLLKGFWFYPGIALYDGFEPLPVNDSSGECEEFAETAGIYLEKISALCRQNQIQLILVKTPCHVFTQARHNKVWEWADRNQIPFIDFNVQDIYRETGFEFGAGDMDDIGKSNAHANPSGARKMSRYLADYIAEQGYAVGTADEQWECTKAFNDHLFKDFKLANTTELSTYLDLLNDPGYTVFISAKEDAGAGMPEESRQALSELGLRENWNDAYQCGYLAVIDKQSIVYEKLSRQKQEYSGSFRDGLVRIAAASAGYNAGNVSSIRIDGTEYSRNRRGLNIVVYNNERHCVIDSVNFDTSDVNMVCSR